MTEAQKQLLIVLTMITTSPDYYAGGGHSSKEIHDHILNKVRTKKGDQSWVWDVTFKAQNYIDTAVATGGGVKATGVKGTNAYYNVQKDFTNTASAVGWSGGGEHPRVEDLVDALNLQ